MTCILRLYLLKRMSKLHLNTNIIVYLFWNLLPKDSSALMPPSSQPRRSLILTVVQNYTFVLDVTVSHCISHFQLPWSNIEPSMPIPLPAMTRAEISPSPLLGLPNSQSNELQDVYVKWGMPRGEKIADRNKWHSILLHLCWA